MSTWTQATASVRSAVFGPRDLACLGDAYDAALALAAGEDGPFAVLPGRELRQRLAQAVLDGARHGVLERDRLRAFALRAVAAPLTPRPVDAAA